MANASILDELRPALRLSIAALAEALLGPPDTRNGRELRWGAKGSFRVIVSGSKQGACCDFEGGWKGDPLALIMRERRTDFQRAVEYGCQFVGIAFDAKSRAADPAERAARDAARERKRAEASLEQKTDEAERIAYARNLWNASGPIDGTVALEYLAITRAIPRPATGWPDATVRYHAGTASLILAGTNAVGEVCFVQRIGLTIEGRKVDGTPKITNGVMAGCYMRLPSLRDGSILLLAEGAETALSTWTATGYETWASIGSIARHDPPTGRQIVVVRDDDPQQSPADQALKRSMSTWLAGGVDVTIATPWPVRRHDRSDFNDTIKEAQ
jgi:Toprim domain